MPLPEHYVTMIAGFKGRLRDLLTELGELKGGSSFRCPHHLLPSDHDNHHEDKTGSASLTSRGTNFLCHRCGAVGDIIDFTRLYFHVDWIKAVNWLNAKYNLGKHDLATPIANQDVSKYRPQFAKGRAPIQTNNKVTEHTTIIQQEGGMFWEPPIWKREYLDDKDRQKAVNTYRNDLIEEGTRIIKAGHGVVLFQPMGVQKKPIYLPEQPHGAKEPIKDVNTLKSVLQRLITTVEDIDNVLLGISLMNRLLCIDIDMRNGKNGLLALRRLELALGEDLPLKTYECTRSFGRHFFFRLPSGYDVIGQYSLGSRVGCLMGVDGIEIMTGCSGVVVAPSTGYTRFEAGWVRGWKNLAKLPPKWTQLLSQSGPKADKLMRPQIEWFKTSNSEIAI